MPGWRGRPGASDGYRAALVHDLPQPLDRTAGGAGRGAAAFWGPGSAGYVLYIQWLALLEIQGSCPLTGAVLLGSACGNVQYQRPEQCRELTRAPPAHSTLHSIVLAAAALQHRQWIVGLPRKPPAVKVLAFALAKGLAHQFTMDLL